MILLKFCLIITLILYILSYQDESSEAYDVDIDLDELLDIEGDFNRKEWLGVSQTIIASLKVCFVIGFLLYAFFVN